ncbi:MAG: inositol monophosphatase family protein [Acidimicrobiales bacterium]
MSDVDWNALRELGMAMAAEAGKFAVAERGSAVIDVGTKSSTVDIVTAADEAAEVLITARLGRDRPNDGIVGEEGANRDGTTGLTWFIDPIDGTTNFFYDLSGWVVSVAVGDNNGIGAAAVFDPVADEMYSAYRNGGAWLNGEPLKTRTTTASLTHALVGTGFSYLADQRQQQAELLVKLLPRVRDIRRLGSAAKDLCLLARGSYDAYYEAGLNQWDLAAGWLIAVEAGARVEFLAAPEDGRPVLLGSAPQLFDELATIIG